MANSVRKLAGQTAIYGMSSMVARLLNYFLVPLYTYVFATAEYGVVTEFYAYVSFLIIILTYGMETGFFRYSESEYGFKKTYSTALGSLLTTSLLFLVIVNIFASPISNSIGYPNNTEWIRWFSVILAFDAFSAIPFAKLRYRNQAKRFALIKIINISISISLNLFFIVLCPQIAEKNPDSFLLFAYHENIGIGYIFISNLVASVLTLVLLLPDILEVKIHIDKKLWRAMIWYSLPLLIGGLAGMVNETLDRLLLKRLLPGTQEEIMSQIGIYGANYKLSILMTLFIQMFRYAAEPFFFSSAKDKTSKTLFANVMNWFVIFGLLIFLGITGYIDIIKYFIGKDYHEGLSIVPILLIANLCLGIYFNLSVWYKLNNKTRFGAYFALIGAGITLALNFILIPYIGYMGSAVATMICYASMMIISWAIGRKHYPIPYQLKTLAIYAGITAGIYGLFTLTDTLGGWVEIALNTILILSFITFAFFKENMLKQLKRAE